MSNWKRFKFNTDIEDNKSDKIKCWFELKEIEKAIGQSITWIYSNNITTNSIADDCYHKYHSFFIWVVKGQLTIELEDVKTKEKETIILNENDDLLSIPTYVHHKLINNFDRDCLAIMFATTQPKDETDSYEK